MAKVQFSCLVNRMIGRLNDVVYTYWRGINIAKSYPLNPNHPNSTRQQQIKSNLSSLASKWWDLPEGSKNLWNTYSAMLKSAASGYNCHISLNGCLLNASHSDLVYRPSPPPHPGTAAHVRGFCVFAMSSTQVCISWLKPDTASLYVTAHFKLHKGFCSRFPSYGLCPTIGYRPSLRFIETVRSDQRYIVFNHDWPPNCRLWFRCNSIDKFGRKSPLTHFINFLNIA